MPMSETWTMNILRKLEQLDLFTDETTIRLEVGPRDSVLRVEGGNLVWTQYYSYADNTAVGISLGDGDVLVNGHFRLDNAEI